MFGLRNISSLWLWLVIGLVVPAVVIAVSERHFFEVEHEGETELMVSLDIALGTVEIGKADEGFLFQAEVLLENDRLEPDFDYRVRGGKGRLNVELSTVKDEDDNVSIPDLGSVKESTWKIFFGDAVPIDLKLMLGGTSSELDFSGIPLRTLRIEMDASKGSIVFNELNPVEMDYLRIESGASELSVTGLGYSRAERMRFDVGMGKFSFDFTDNAHALRGTVVDIEVGMARLDIQLPRSGPILLDVPDSWFCKVDVPNGYIKAEDGIYHSPDFTDDDDAFVIMVDAAIGTVNFATR